MEEVKKNMTYDELNEFILNYLKNDITGRTIMINGEWGVGKSHYIKNELKPFLIKKEKKCIIVSLYGLSDITEISKAIFLELHPILKKLSPAKSTAQAVGKTLLNAVSNKIGFDIDNPSEETLKQLYESINLSGTLVILEDIERTQIEITKLLGYVNNLCENDHAKVLLITNENELLTTYEVTNSEGKKVRYYTDLAIAYKRIKEKTVGDTIHFVCDFKSAIQTIISSFGIHLNKFNTEKSIEDILNIFMRLNSFNLRAFIYGCQKCKNLFEFISDRNIIVNDRIEEMIFYGVIAFTQRKSKDSNIKFDSDVYLSGRLGVDDKLPLFRFCYDYIEYQMISEEEIKKSVSYYSEYLKKGKWNSGRDKDLKVIKAHYVETENKVRKALLNIPKKIMDGSIPYHDYGVLANCVVAIRYDADIDFDIEEIIKPIIDSLKTISDNIDFESLFSSGYTISSNEGIEYFKQVKQRMKDALTGVYENDEFPYTPSEVKDYYKKLTKESREYLRRRGFAYKIDIKRLIFMLKHSSSEVISIIRSLFMELYSDDYTFRASEEDISALISIRDSLAVLSDYKQYDKIQKMQIKWFIQNLSDMILNFESQKTNTH